MTPTPTDPSRGSTAASPRIPPGLLARRPRFVRPSIEPTGPMPTTLRRAFRERVWAEWTVIAGRYAPLLPGRLARPARASRSR